MTGIEQVMVFKKSTKNTHVFEAKSDDTNQPLTTIYVNKVAMNTPPDSIKVVIEGWG